MAKAAKRIALVVNLKEKKPVRLKRYKVTSIGSHAKPTNKHKRLASKRRYRGQGRP
jgi:hypothetical protein